MSRSSSNRRSAVFPRYFARCLLPLAAIGCLSTGSSDLRDRTDIAEYWGGYIPFATYELQMDLFVVTQNRKDILGLSAPDNGTYHAFSLYGVPSSIDKFRENPGRYPRIKQVLERGARVKCIRVMAFESEDWSDVTSVVAQILDGPLAGQEIDLRPISLEIQKSHAITAREPNTSFVTLYVAPAQGSHP